MSYKVVKSDVVYEGKICNVKLDEITLPDGRTALREVVEHGEATAIVAVDNEGKLLLVRQYRHPALREVLEIPAGMIDEGEEPEVCAIRELEEETSFKPGKITHVTSAYTAIGFCTEILHVYIAEDLIQGKFNFDEDEFITIEKYSLDESLDLIYTGKIVDSKTILGIFAYDNFLRKNKM